MTIDKALIEVDKLITYYNHNCKPRSYKISKGIKELLESQQQEIERLKELLK